MCEVTAGQSATSTTAKNLQSNLTESRIPFVPGRLKFFHETNTCEPTLPQARGDRLILKGWETVFFKAQPDDYRLEGTLRNSSQNRLPLPSLDSTPHCPPIFSMARETI